MKPANFPARKEMRRLAAIERDSISLVGPDGRRHVKVLGISAREFANEPAAQAAMAICTKKRRA